MLRGLHSSTEVIEDGEPRKYLLMGEAYVHGVMLGEALAWKGWSEDDFCLV